MQTVLYGKIKERKGEWLIGASTQKLTLSFNLATQHKTKQRRVGTQARINNWQGEQARTNYG